MEPIEVYHLGLVPYQPVWQAMRELTDQRDGTTPDQIWVVQHPPVFTQGQAGKAEHLLMPSEIPLVETDRGGQITYHGPGQLVLYPLIDVKRARLGVRDLVSALEDSVVDALGQHGIEAHARPDAPGVYVGSARLPPWGCGFGVARVFTALPSIWTWIWRRSASSIPAAMRG